MAILFAVVARGTTILAKHAWCGGNFLEVTEQILAKIPSENNKLTYSHGNYLFHYICQDRIVYLCITDDDFERSRAFNFLNEIKKRFQTTYGSRAQTALPYAMNSEFSSVLAAQLKHHSENKGLDKVMETQAQVDELKGIMVRNIDLVAQRGERLELLIDKTENLVDSSREMMLDKKQIRAVFLFEFKMSHKAAVTTHNINNAFGPGTANEHTLQWWFKKFCKGDKSLEDKEHSGWLLEADDDRLRASLKLMLLKHKRLPKNSASIILW
ncbi:vesicle-associated membrane protein 7 isoform X1 [Ovis canadensis]|uniref:vesicle-associated membrane protein 7 isoform X1 n=1 Tax=Ovis canadensis TaxID=37174 RepID=UPI0038B41B04